MVLFPNKTLEEKIECCLKSKDPYYYLFKMYFSFYAHINPKFFNIMYRKWRQRNLYEIAYIIKNMHNMNYSLIVHNKYIKMKKMKNLRLNNENSWIKFLNKKEDEKAVNLIPSSKLYEGYLCIANFYNGKNSTLKSAPVVKKAFEQVKECLNKDLRLYLLAICTYLNSDIDDINFKKTYISLTFDELQYIKDKIENNKDK